MAIHVLRSLVRGPLAAAWVVGLLSSGWCAPGVAAEPLPAAVCQAGDAGRHGTEVDWVATPEEAAKRAAVEGKLLMLMQISGNFAREEFT